MPEIKPDRCDFERLDQEYGTLPSNASVEERADRYRLAQAAKLIRVAPDLLERGGSRQSKKSS